MFEIEEAGKLNIFRHLSTVQRSGWQRSRCDPAHRAEPPSCRGPSLTVASRHWAPMHPLRLSASTSSVSDMKTSSVTAQKATTRRIVARRSAALRVAVCTTSSKQARGSPIWVGGIGWLSNLVFNPWSRGVRCARYVRIPTTRSVTRSSSMSPIPDTDQPKRSALSSTPVKPPEVSEIFTSVVMLPWARAPNGPPSRSPISVHAAHVEIVRHIEWIDRPECTKSPRFMCEPRPSPRALCPTGKWCSSRRCSSPLECT